MLLFALMLASLAEAAPNDALTQEDCPIGTQLRGDPPRAARTATQAVKAARSAGYEQACFIKGPHGWVRHGPSRSWSPSGMPLSSGDWVAYNEVSGERTWLDEPVKDGEWSTWRRDSPMVQSAGEYRLGERIGSWMSTDPDGALEWPCHADGAQRAGRCSDPPQSPQGEEPTRASGSTAADSALVEASPAPQPPLATAPQVNVKLDIVGFGPSETAFMWERRNAIGEALALFRNSYSDAGVEFAVEIAYADGQVWITITEIGHEAKRQGLGVERHPLGHFVDCSRAGNLMTSASRWPALTLIPHALEQGMRSLAIALGQARYGAVFAAPGDRFISVPGRQLRSGGFAGWFVPGSPIQIGQGESAVLVPPKAGAIEGNAYFIEEPVGLDGRPSAASAVYSFFGEE